MIRMKSLALWAAPVRNVVEPKKLALDAITKSTTDQG